MAVNILTFDFLFFNLAIHHHSTLMKRPLKWKLFNVANGIMFFLIGLSFVSLFITFTYSVKTSSSINVFLTVAIVSLLMLGNYLFNFYVLRKFYPNKPFTRSAKSINLLLLIFNIIIWLLLLFSSYWQYKKLQIGSGQLDIIGKFSMAFLALIILIQGFILALQLTFESVLAKNNVENMLELIDSIGEEKPL